MAPGDAMRRRALEIELLPPTCHARASGDVRERRGTLDACRDCTPERFATRIASVPGGGLTLWQGDGYESGDPTRRVAQPPVDDARRLALRAQLTRGLGDRSK
jgi:hypothetical protein